MKVLLLEDSEQRHAWFKERFKDIDITDVPAEAIELLKKNSYDLICLDHDLEWSHYLTDCQCKESTGLAVAKWLGENPDNNPKAKILIHSCNGPGSIRMQESLNRPCTRIPFSYLIDIVGLTRLLKLVDWWDK